MISRCYNKNNKRYDRYGGRGIDICDCWLDKTNGFINFYQEENSFVVLAIIPMPSDLSN